MRSILPTVLVLLAVAARPAAAHVKLLYPEGGETFEAGQQIEIEWVEEIAHETENWDLYFSSDGGATWEVIEADLHATRRTYVWTVPNTSTEHGQVQVIQDNVGGDYPDASGDFTVTAVATSRSSDPELPARLVISEPHPNPFVDRTTIGVSLSRAGRLSASVYDMRGALVEVLADGLFGPGRHKLDWSPSGLGNGVYLLRLEFGERVRSLLLVQRR